MKMEFTGDPQVFSVNFGELQMVKGENGLSAYEIAVQNGFEGTEQEWLQSLKGDAGEAGPQGPKGDTPVKGQDYYTEADKDEMIAAVIAALPVYTGEVENV